MTLDLDTLYLFSALTIATVLAIFVVEVARRGATPVDRIWTLALGSALSTAILYASAAAVPELWWCVALGNGVSALTTFALWSGIRGYNGRRPLLGVGAAVASFCALATLIQGPEGGAWAAGGAMLAATGVGSLLAASAAARGRMREVPSGPVLVVVLTVVWAYYMLRFGLYLTQGPYSAAFLQYAGTELTTLVLTLLVLIAAFVMVAARGEHVRAQWRARHGFDPVTGARTPAAFRRRGAEVLESARRAGQPVAVASVIVQDLRDLVTGYDTDHADEAVIIVAERCVEQAPPGAVVGRAGSEVESFDVLVLGLVPTEVTAWAEELRKRVIDSPLRVPGGTVRLRVSIGVATDTAGHATLTELCGEAVERAREALAAGGNRVLASGRSGHATHP